MKVKRLAWVSLTLLLVCYMWFGWYLSGLRLQPPWFESVCYWVFGDPIATQTELRYDARSLEQASEPHESKLDKPNPTKTKKSAESKPSVAIESEAADASTPAHAKAICRTLVRHNLPFGFLAVGWIFLSSVALMSPLTNFSAFITRWFTSDTIAFTSLFLLAGLAAVILFWLHVFLQILTILAVDMLARIDIQSAGLNGLHAFWILTLVSLTGLTIGWIANTLIS